MSVLSVVYLFTRSSYLSTEQLKYISALSKLQESADMSAVRYTNLNSIASKPTQTKINNYTNNMYNNISGLVKSYNTIHRVNAHCRLQTKH